MSKVLQSHWLSISFVLLFPLLIMYVYSDFIRSSEFSARVGWLILLGGVAYLFRKTWLQKVFLGILFLFVISGSMDILYAVTFGGVFSKASFEAFALTDINETIEFIEAYLSFENVFALIFYWVTAFLLVKNIILSEVESRRQRVFLWLGILMVIVAIQQIVIRDRARDTIPGFSGVGIDYSLVHEGRVRTIENRKRQLSESTFDVSIKSDKKQVYIVVIGESLTRNKMSIYDYARETTPNLEEKLSELVVFDNTISNYAQTNPSLGVALTVADTVNNKSYYSALSLVDVYTKAGFKTYWMSNHNSKKALAATANEQKYISHDFYGVNVDRYDGYVIPYVKKALADEADKKVIFIHLMGSHLQYENRYPSEFSTFNGRKDVNAYRENLSASEIKFINSYDNSVLYTDFVLNEILEELQKTTSIAALSFWSDHGEEVFDVKAFKGHGPDGITKNMFEVPFIFWRNDAYIKEFSKVDEMLRSHTGSPIMLDDFFHIAHCMFPLESDLLDKSKSLCETEYDSKPRMVYGKNYDKELK